MKLSKKQLGRILYEEVRRLKEGSFRNVDPIRQAAKQGPEAWAQAVLNHKDLKLSTAQGIADGIPKSLNELIGLLQKVMAKFPDAQPKIGQQFKIVSPDGKTLAIWPHDSAIHPDIQRVIAKQLQ